MYALVLSDPHGLVWDAFRIAMHLCDRLNIDLDTLLVAGDLGYFPSTGQLDAATMRFALEDPSELGFPARFERSVAGIENWLDTSTCLPPEMYFIRGNHEDHEALARYAGADHPCIVDAYGLIYHLPDAVPLQCGRDDKAPTVVGLGGVESFGSGPSHPLLAIQHRAADRILAMQPRSADILITHDPPRGLPDHPDEGSALVRRVVDWLQPEYSFSGHMHVPLGPVDMGETKCIGIAELRSGRPGPPEPEAVMLLRWASREDHEIVELPTDIFEDWQWAPPPILRQG